MAKEISATHKPNAQTIVLRCDQEAALKSITLRNARGLRGKTGDLVASTLPQSIHTLYDLRQLSLNDLLRMLATSGLKDKTIRWLYNLGRYDVIFINVLLAIGFP